MLLRYRALTRGPAQAHRLLPPKIPMRLHSTLALALGLCLPGLAHADVQRFTGDGFVITATTADQPVAGATTDVQLAITPTSGHSPASVGVRAISTNDSPNAGPSRDVRITRRTTSRPPKGPE